MECNRLNKNVLSGIYYITTLFILLTQIITCSSPAKKVREVSCPNGSSLILTVEKEFVELSYQNVYNLAYKNNKDGRPRIVTGNISILPEAKRYREMIKIRDFTPGKAKSLFQYHYLFPSHFTGEEFDLICSCYEKNIDKFPELHNKIGAIVYGNYNSFREIFRLPDGFFIMTEYNGNLTIVDDPSGMALTLPAEKRHFNNIGYFDDTNRLHLRRGRIVSDTFKGFYGKPVKQVEFITENGKVEYTGEVEIIWCDRLYNDKSFGINRDYVLSAVNDKGMKLCEVFNCRENK